MKITLYLLHNTRCYGKLSFRSAISSNQCFKVSWVMEALHDGLRFPKEYTTFLPVSEINGQEVQWSLGALIHRTRYIPLKYVPLVHKFYNSVYECFECLVVSLHRTLLVFSMRSVVHLTKLINFHCKDSLL